MNAYFVHAGECNVVAEYIDFWPRYEPQFVCDIVYAYSRGRAKSLFFQKYYVDIGEYIAIQSCRIVAKNVNRGEGFATSDDPLWGQVPEH